VYKCNVIPFVSIQRLLLRSLLRFHGVTMSDDSLSAELFHINYVENLAAMSSLVDLRNFYGQRLAVACSTESLK
jgi:ribulose-5-phosphate 4-epimerase/fuculose-1-phosphate aldolase